MYHDSMFQISLNHLFNAKINSKKEKNIFLVFSLNYICTVERKHQNHTPKNITYYTEACRSTAIGNKGIIKPASGCCVMTTLRCRVIVGIRSSMIQETWITNVRNRSIAKVQGWSHVPRSRVHRRREPARSYLF